MNLIISDSEKGAVLGKAVDAIVQAYAENGASKSREEVMSSEILSFRTLRSMQKLTDGQTDTKFTFDKTSGNNSVVAERRLNEADAFIAAWYSVKIYREVSGDFLAIDPMSYADPVVFAKANEAKGIKTIWDLAELSLKTGNVERIPGLDVAMTKFVPERIAAAATDPIQSGASMEENGFVRILPSPILSGRQTNVFYHTFGNGDQAVMTPTSGNNWVALELHGIYASDLGELFKKKADKMGDGACNL